MAQTLIYSGHLTVVTCWCGMRHAIPVELHEDAKQNPKNGVFCPLGHEWVVRESEADKLKRQLERERNRSTSLRGALDRTEAEAKHQAQRAAGFKGALTKAKKRIGKGVCPACNRHFENVERHMHTQHPDLAQGMDDAG